MQHTLTTQTEFNAALNAGLQLGESRQTDEDGIPYVVLAGEQKVESLEHLLPAPARTKGTAAFLSAESFIAYVDEWKSDATRLFADVDGAQVTALLDFHEPGAASWNVHRATLTLRQSPEWDAWLQRDGRQMPQADFAEFLEDRVGEIAEPDGAMVLEAAKHLEARKTVEFTSGVNLDNGTIQLRFQEAVEQRGKGELTVPSRFVLGLAPFRHTKPYRINARLRYRIQDARLSFAYKLDRPERVREEAFGQVLAQVTEATGLPVLFGRWTG